MGGSGAGREVILGPADRVKHGLARRQEAIAIWPSMIIGGAVSVRAGEVQSVRGVVGRARPALVGAILADEQAAGQRMLIRGKTKGVPVPIPPRDGLDRVVRMGPIELGS